MIKGCYLELGNNFQFLFLPSALLSSPLERGDRGVCFSTQAKACGYIIWVHNLPDLNIPMASHIPIMVEKR